MNQEEPIDFGLKPEQEFIIRPSVYAVAFNNDGKILALKVGENFHLVGGGIENSEDLESALIREAQEEAGCELINLEYIGKANQFFIESKLGPLKKEGTFYKASINRIDSTQSIEPDHEVRWLTPEDFINSKASDFYKWAVRKCIDK